MHNNTVRQNVARGAALLDEKMPGWEDKIDLERLSMYDGCDCILGQLAGMYHRGRAHLRINLGDGYDYGFHAQKWDKDGNFIAGTSWDNLQYEWTRLLISRKASR